MEVVADRRRMGGCGWSLIFLRSWWTRWNNFGFIVAVMVLRIDVDHVPPPIFRGVD
jgi:hypothetical protein